MNYNPPTPVERALARNRWIRRLIVLLLILAALYWLIFVNQYVVAYPDILSARTLIAAPWLSRDYTGGFRVGGGWPVFRRRTSLSLGINTGAGRSPHRNLPGSCAAPDATSRRSQDAILWCHSTPSRLGGGDSGSCQPADSQHGYSGRKPMPTPAMLVLPQWAGTASQR